VDSVLGRLIGKEMPEGFGDERGVNPYVQRNVLDALEHVGRDAGAGPAEALTRLGVELDQGLRVHQKIVVGAGMRRGSENRPASLWRWVSCGEPPAIAALPVRVFLGTPHVRSEPKVMAAVAVAALTVHQQRTPAEESVSVEEWGECANEPRLLRGTQRCDRDEKTVAERKMCHL